MPKAHSSCFKHRRAAAETEFGGMNPAELREVGKGSNNKIGDTFLIPALALLCQYHQEQIHLSTTAL